MELEQRRCNQPLVSPEAFGWHTYSAFMQGHIGDRVRVRVRVSVSVRVRVSVRLGLGFTLSPVAE